MQFVFTHNTIDYKNGIAIPDKYIGDFRIAPANSVLMCIEGGSAGRKIGILSQDVCFGNKLCCFSPYADISEYIFYYLQSPLFFEIFSSNKTTAIPKQLKNVSQKDGNLRLYLSSLSLKEKLNKGIHFIHAFGL